MWVMRVGLDIYPLKLSSEGQLYGLQSFGYSNGNFDLNSSAVLKIDPISGTSSPFPVSRPLQLPSALEFGQGSKFGSETLLNSDILVSEGVGPVSNPDLIKIDTRGNVITL